MSGDDRYRVIYDFAAHPEGVKLEDVPKGKGACDAILACSIVRHPNGATSMAVFTLDGATDAPMAPGYLWSLWVMLAAQLSENEALDGDRRELCANVYQAVREAIQEEKTRVPPPTKH